MPHAAAANAIKSNIGPDYSLAFELAEFEAEEVGYVPVNVETMPEDERREFNAAMFVHYYG